MRHYRQNCYRTLFPKFQNAFTARHCPGLCQPSREGWSQISQAHAENRRRFAHRPDTAAPELIDKRVHQIRNSATALLKFKDVTLERIAEYEALLCEWYGLPQPQPQEQHLELMMIQQQQAPIAPPTPLTTAQLQRRVISRVVDPTSKYIWPDTGDGVFQ
jgi:hypothetical protein